MGFFVPDKLNLSWGLLKNYGACVFLKFFRVIIDHDSQKPILFPKKGAFDLFYCFLQVRNNNYRNLFYIVVSFIALSMIF